VAEVGSAVTNRFVWGLDLSGAMQGAGGVGGLLAQATADAAGLRIDYATYDANGNVTEYMASDGSVAARYVYDPFGRIVEQSGAMAGIFLHRFSTQPFEPETALVHYQFRPYSPELGRWLNRDPIGEGKGGVGLYVFVKNAAILGHDSLGQMGSWNIVPDTEHPGEFTLTPPDWDHDVPRCEIDILVGHRTAIPRSIKVKEKDKDCATGAAYGCFTAGGTADYHGKTIHTPPVPSPGIPGVPQTDVNVNDSELGDLAEHAFQAAKGVAESYCGKPCCCIEVVIRTVVLMGPTRPDYPEDTAFLIRMSKLTTVISCLRKDVK
jgi:RHS repeat-associated protein